jgi:4-hydroxy-3-polyprenylbenzoate decarboxylase
MKPIIVATTEATGAIYGICLIRVLRERSIEVHLMVSPRAEKTIGLEAEYSVIF